MKKILLIVLFSISFSSAEINEYVSDVYFANGIDTSKKQAYKSIKFSGVKFSGVRSSLFTKIKFSGVRSALFTKIML